eukprot:9991303-Karenia_brevis.AAC.1
MVTSLDDLDWDLVMLQEVTNASADLSTAVKGHELFLSKAFGRRKRSGVLLNRKWLPFFKQAFSSYYAVAIDTDGFSALSLHMPCRGGPDTYNVAITEITAMMSCFSPETIDRLVVGGDFNCHLQYHIDPWIGP